MKKLHFNKDSKITQEELNMFFNLPIISLNDMSEFHKNKFGKMPAQRQMQKITEEWEEAFNAPTLDEMLKEFMDLILAVVGLYNSYDADINEYARICLDKVAHRPYPDNFKHIDVDNEKTSDIIKTINN